MLDGIKRWLGSPAKAEASPWASVMTWAEAHQYGFRAVPEQGFVVDGRLGTTPWRLEWGPSQRPYIQGHELRLRAELGLGSELQMLVMNRGLAEQMEKAVFEQYVEGVQTRIDNQTPPEMRWLVMFPKLAASEMGELRRRYAALGSIKVWLQSWLQGPLSAALEAYPRDDTTPLVIMIARGRLTLRTALAQPELRAVQSALRLFETALRESERTARAKIEPAPASSVPSSWTAGETKGSDGAG